MAKLNTLQAIKLLKNVDYWEPDTREYYTKDYYVSKDRKYQIYTNLFPSSLFLSSYCSVVLFYIPFL